MQPYRTIHDDHPAEWLTLRGAIQVSSNIGIVKFTTRMRPGDQYRYLRDYGFGTPTGDRYCMNSISLNFTPEPSA